jgi:hypothetical protein
VREFRGSAKTRYSFAEANEPLELPVFFKSLIKTFAGFLFRKLTLNYLGTDKFRTKALLFVLECPTQSCSILN